MPHAQPTCHLPHARTPDSSQNFPAPRGIPCQTTPRPDTSTHDTLEHVCDSGQPGRGCDLNVAAAHQWVTTTTGRITNDPHSWLTACHWTGDESGFKPARTHGPAWGPTTMLIAKEISALTECRPGVDYLARKLGLSERTVQYHLGLLREAGLLVYRAKGTRISRGINQASVFERVIPAAFDRALGIRTIQRDDTASAYTRVPVGIAEESRTLIGKLAKKAARKIRKPRRRSITSPKGASKDTVSGGSLCTPMQGGTSASSTTGTSISPSESKLASGKKPSPTPKQQKRGPRKLNRVGRRYQLAGELITLLPWMNRASVRRIAWVIRHVADAGWSVDEVRAVIDQMQISDTVHRPSGYLARRLTGAHDLWNTPARRKHLVDDWRDTKRATADRHTEWASEPAPDTNPRLVAQFMTGLEHGKAAYAARQAALGHDNLNSPTSASNADAEADFAAFFASADTLTGAF